MSEKLNIRPGVNLKMIDSLDGVAEFDTEYENDPETGISGVCGILNNPEEIAQAVVNAAWVEFNPLDPEDWPRWCCPSGGPWMIIRNGSICMELFNLHAWRQKGNEVTHYANPKVFKFISESGES